MARKLYNDADKAGVLVSLTVNDNNIKRTHRDTGIPESTIRDWRAEWDRDGVPPELLEVSETIATDVLGEMEEVRDLALVALKAAIKSGDLKNEKLITVIGVLEDKIRLGKGLVTSRSETVQSLPDPKELQELLGGYIRDSLDLAKKREEEIEKVGVQEIIPSVRKDSKELTAPRT